MFTALVLFLAGKSIGQSELYLQKIRTLRSYGYTISDQMKVNCAQGAEGVNTRTFYKGTTYIIVGCSDDQDVNDVDLFLTDEDNTELKKDTDASNLAVLSFEPNYNVTLKVFIKNYKSSTPYFASTLRYVVAYK